MIFSECKNVTAPLVLANNPIRVMAGDPVILACNRFSDKINCQLTFEGGQEGVRGKIGEYTIIMDAPPVLIFKLIVGTEFIAVNTTTHSAVMSSLILDLEYIGSKVCHGAHLTSFEYKALQKGKQ